MTMIQIFFLIMTPFIRKLKVSFIFIFELFATFVVDNWIFLFRLCSSHNKTILLFFIILSGENRYAVAFFRRLFLLLVIGFVCPCETSVSVCTPPSSEEGVGAAVEAANSTSAGVIGPNSNTGTVAAATQASTSNPATNGNVGAANGNTSAIGSNPNAAGVAPTPNANPATNGNVGAAPSTPTRTLEVTPPSRPSRTPASGGQARHFDRSQVRDLHSDIDDEG